MRKLINIGVLVLTFQLAAFGCSGDKTEETKEPAKDTKQVVQTPDENRMDYRHPIRDKSNPIVTLETNFGNLTLELYRDVAPAHADSFLARTKDGFYSSTIFHRVRKNFVIQGGNALAAGKERVKYTLESEVNDLPHKEGTMSMARANDPNSAKTQFFVCLTRNTSIAWLDGKYTNFGQLIKGYDVLQKISDVPVGPSKWLPNEVSQPVEEVKLIKAYHSDAEGNPAGL